MRTDRMPERDDGKGDKSPTQNLGISPHLVSPSFPCAFGSVLNFSGPPSWFAFHIETCLKCKEYFKCP